MDLNQSHTSIRLPFNRLIHLLFIRRRLRQHDRWSRAELLHHQNQSLEKLRAHAYAHSPFYRRFHEGLMDKPLHELPVLTKKEVMENWNDIVTDPTLKIDELRKFIEAQIPDNPLLFRSEYVASTTSGSTGLKGVFVFNRDEWLWGLASHGRATEWAKAKTIGLLHRPKLATVSSRQPWCKSLLVGASVDTPLLSSLRLDSTEPLHVLCKNLNEFKPEILIAYAETAKALAQRQMNGDLAIFPQAVFTSSEILTQHAKDTITQAWGHKPFNAYAATETALIAADCEHHRMHLCEDLVIVEIVDQNNQPMPSGVYGEKMLVTVLFSRAVPLIRYEMSDSVALATSETRCACNKPFTLISGIQGRTEDTIHLENTDHKRVPLKPDIFHDVLEPALVSGWQVVQESKTGIVVSVVGPQTGYNENDLADKLRNRLTEQGVQNPGVRIEIIEKLRQSASGKTPLVKALKW
jgi:putative adenylate-forming enzyme